MRISDWSSDVCSSDLHVRGSKRVLYEASNNFSGRLARQSTLLDTLGKLIRERTPAVASGATASRLQLLSGFYLSMAEEMAAPIREHEARLAKIGRATGRERGGRYVIVLGGTVTLKKKTNKH